MLFFNEGTSPFLGIHWEVKDPETLLTWRLLFVRFLQVKQRLVEFAKVIVSHSRAVKRFKVLPLLPQHLQTVLLHPLIVHQLHLQETGWRKGTQENTKNSSYLHTHLSTHQQVFLFLCLLNICIPLFFYTGVKIRFDFSVKNSTGKMDTSCAYVFSLMWTGASGKRWWRAERWCKREWTDTTSGISWLCMHYTLTMRSSHSLWCNIFGLFSLRETVQTEVSGQRITC